MHTVTSLDGTTIAYDRLGHGPAIVLVTGGGATDRTVNAPLAALLAQHLTVFNYDRRGRSDSGDTQPYAVEREFDDLAAVLAVAGGSAGVYGTSSGGVLALEASRALPGITKLALWEPPYIPAGYRKPPVDTARTYTELVAVGRRGDAVEYFMAQVVGLPAEIIAQVRQSPMWPGLEARAQTLAYDAILMGDQQLPAERVASIAVPTLVLAGGASFPWMAETAQAMVDLLPQGQRRTLDGQDHNVDPAVLAPVLVEFFGA